MIRPLLGGGCSECKATDDRVGKGRCKHILCQSSNNALNTLNIIQESGGEAYLVGGCVRDMVLNQKPHDEDITTSLTPDQVISLFESKGYEVIPTGLQHGTVTVMMDGEGYEITTFRKDGDYSDGRHPDSVEFSTNVEDDCSRRDFTFNAMYYDGKQIVDTYNGQKDIEDKVIRTVGDPNERFNEDALRMMRAVRFSSKLGFTIAPEVTASISKNKDLIHNVSAERIQAEMTKMLQGPNKRYALQTMQQTGLMKEVMPELDALKSVKQKSKYHYEDAFEHTMSVMDNCPDDVQVQYAAMFHDLGKGTTKQVDPDGTEHFKGHSIDSAKQADEICRRLKMSTADRETIVKLVKYHDRPDDAEMKNVRKSAAKFVYEHQDLTDDEYKKLEQLWIADRKAHKDPNTESLNNYIKELDGVLAGPHRISELSVKGDDLLALGYKGPQIGKAQKYLLKQSLANNTNDKDKLIKLLNGFKGE